MINNIISLVPNTLIDIENAAIEIIRDGKIDVKDIPHFIILLQIIYKNIYSLKGFNFGSKKSAEFALTSLKYIIHLLVLERKIKMDEDKQTECLTQIDTLIDSCVSLLIFSKTIKVKGCFKKIFG